MSKVRIICYSVFGAGVLYLDSLGYQPYLKHRAISHSMVL